MSAFIFLNAFLEIASKVNNIFALICMMGIGAFFFLRGKGKDGKEVDKTTLFVLGGLAVLLSVIGAWAHTQTPEDVQAKNEELVVEITEFKADLKSLQDSIATYKFKLGECKEKGQNCAEIGAQLATANTEIDELKTANANLKAEIDKHGIVNGYTSKGCNSVQYNFVGGFAVVYDKDTKRWGYRSKNQSLQGIDFIYHGATAFSDGMAGVRGPNGKWGFINGNFILAIDYKYDNPLAFKDGKARVEYEGKEIWIDKNGKEIEELGEE